MSDVKMEGKSLNDYSMDRLAAVAKISDEEVTPIIDTNKKVLKEEHYLKLYWFKTEHDKISATMQMLRQELQKYGASIISDYFPNDKGAVINLEERSISKKSLIEEVKVELELPK